jgi:hypothetical protein
MARAKWLDQLRVRLSKNPLYFRPGETVPTCLQCLGGIPTGKKLALYQVTNYSNLQWNRCQVCQCRY